MEVLEYLDRAKARLSITSDHELSRRLGKTRTYVCQLRLRRILPDEDAMIRIGELAGVDPETALLDLVMTRAKSDQERATWQRIRQRVVAACLAVSIVGASSSANAASTNGQRVANVCILSQIMEA